ncbi:hypothetical protein DL767_000486 [Monosporascus sp. MG133]|nr:hypothetical protein DL767_000486 [Monosporascus sp. MG133]
MSKSRRPFRAHSHSVSHCRPRQSEPAETPRKTTPLCEDCAKLDLEQSLASAFALYEGARRGTISRPLGTYGRGSGPAYLKDFYHVVSLGDRLSRETNNCKAMRISSRPRRAEPNTRGTTHKLLAFCTSESFLFEAARRDARGRLLRRRGWAVVEHNVFMAVVPEDPLVPKTAVPLRWLGTGLPGSGAIYRLTQPRSTDDSRIILPRELEPKTEFALMRAWLDCCRAPTVSASSGSRPAQCCGASASSTVSHSRRGWRNGPGRGDTWR